MRSASITDVNKSSQATEQQRAAMTPGAGLSQPPPLISNFFIACSTVLTPHFPTRTIASPQRQARSLLTPATRRDPVCLTKSLGLDVAERPARSAAENSAQASGGVSFFFFFFLARFGFGFSSYVRFPHSAHKRIAAANEFNIIL
jgi:hypothetical protein